MSKSQSIQRILAQAKEKEKKYDWLAAAEFHKKALGQVLEQKDFLRAGEIEEKVGYAFYRAAMQAQNRSEFKERIHGAVANYEKAKRSYEMLGKQEKKPWIFRCDAMIAYLGYWLLSDAPEKKKSLDKCWNSTKEALNAFEKAGNMQEYGKTYNQLSMTAFFDYALTWDFQAREKTIREATEYGERTIALFSRLDGSYELARAYVKTALYLTIIGFVFTSELEEKERHFKKALGYWQKATELSEETAFLELLSFSGEDFLSWSRDELLVQYEKALGYAKKTKDKYLIGTALDYLVYAVSGKVYETEDPDKGLEFLQKTLRYAEDAKQQFSSISFVSPRGGTFGTNTANAEYYQALASWETNVRKKRDLLKKALMDGTRVLKQAESTGCPDMIRMVHAVLGGALTSLARIETNSEEKRKLLEKALEHRKKYMNIVSQLLRFFHWNLGYAWNALASTQGELAIVEKNVENRKKMLTEAASFGERGLQLCKKDILYSEKKGDLTTFALLGVYQYNYGELLNRLYELTNNNEHQRRAINVFEEAAQSHQKLNIVNRMAECNWKAAISCDRLGEHLKATEYFNMASNNYKSAAEKIPQLKKFYHDHAGYMQGWSEIELAKHHHVGKRYDEAKLHYEKSARLHKSTEHWNYLGSNYDAWARLEEAEDLSRREQTEEAKDFFQQAAKLFVEARKSVGTRLEKIENEDERGLAANLVKASDIRSKYCLGRIALEEARILDRQGNHVESSIQYGVAADRFQEATEALEDESDRQELTPIVELSKAWQMMTKAEAEASPDLYLEASHHFEKAKDHSLDEKSRIMALGHSSFCKALEAGTRFEATRDTTLYPTARRNLEAAANYYLKAGFKTASEYTKATYRLFDAYVYTDKAQTEIEPTKKAQYYLMAEKLLQASVDSYIKAKHPEKGEEVYRLLESVKEERQLAMSLAKVLEAPTVTSATTSFFTPNPTYEKAVGLERFEHADIQVNLTASEGMTVDEEVEVRLDLANVGKESGLLVRIDDLIPSGFKAVASPSQYNVDDGSIDMKGKKFDPLKVETIKLNLRATKPGSVDLNPKVVYVDEAGNFRTCKANPVTVTVHPKLALEFKTKAAQNVFAYLASSFVEDYMKRRLTAQEAGWRSLVQVIKNAEVSSRSVYGSRGHHGSAISELERRGLVETRIFLGERGRGGKIVKARISYEKETVKRLVDQKVAKKE